MDLWRVPVQLLQMHRSTEDKKVYILLKNYRSAKSLSGSDDVDIIVMDFIIMTTIPEMIPIK